MKKKLIVMASLVVSMTITGVFASAATPKYEYNFDGSLNGAKTMTRVGDNENGGNPGTMPVVDESVTALFEDGVNGKAVYLDGTYGLELDAKAVGDTFTLAFWVNPTRFSNYGPIIQIGDDLLSEKQSSKWINLTKTDWDGDSAPIIWSRNEKLDVWPWYLKAYFTAGGGYMIEKNAWSHIVLTVDGSQTAVDPVTGDVLTGTVQSQLYVNGELIGEGPVAAEVFKGDAKVYIGINCWDIIFKGKFDDIKIYDTVLSANEVSALAKNVASAPTATSAPKTGVLPLAMFFGFGAAAFGTGAVVLKKKEK